MHLFGGMRQVNFTEQREVIRQLCRPAVLLLENAGIITLYRVSVTVVRAIFGNLINKEERKHFDALRTQTQLLVEMLLDGAANHLALNGKSIHISIRLARFQELLATGKAQLHKLPALFNTDFSNRTIGIDRPTGNHFEVITILDGALLRRNTFC